MLSPLQIPFLAFCCSWLFVWSFYRSKRRQQSLRSGRRVSLYKERGQGLVEYALILVLVAIVVIAVLLMLGPSIGNIFTQIKDALLHPGGTKILVSASAERTGGGHGNDVVVKVTVSESTTVTATDSQSGGAVSFACSSTCQHTITGVGHEAGTITVSAGGDSLEASYSAKL